MVEKLWRWLIEYSGPRGKIDGGPTRVLFNLHSQKKFRTANQKAELPCTLSRPETDFGPGALKEMTGMQEKLKEEEEINGGSCMGHLKM